MDSNRGPLVLEPTAQPNEPQLQPEFSPCYLSLIFKGPFPASFSLFLSLLQTVNNCSIKIDDDWIRTRVLSSGIGSDHAVNCATTTT